ncbi:MAG: hypothetical protein U9P79_03660 [Candidatus Cloacimonadota bacterium]|nr:hypothetical protein [Candidatus Cloacimonadota bacterium]
MFTFKEKISKSIFIIMLISVLWVTNAETLVVEKKHVQDDFVLTFLNDKNFSCNISYCNSLCVITLKNATFSDMEKLLMQNIFANEPSVNKFSINYTKYDVNIFIYFNFSISAIYKEDFGKKLRKSNPEQNLYPDLNEYLSSNPLIIYYDISAERDSVDLFTNQIGGRFDSKLKNAYPFFHFYDLNYSERGKNVRKDLNIIEEENTPDYIWKYRKKFAKKIYESKTNFVFLNNSNLLLINFDSQNKTTTHSTPFGSDEKIIFGEKITIIPAHSNSISDAKEKSTKQTKKRIVTNERYGHDFYYGKRYFQNKEYDKAIESLEKTVSKNEYSEEALQLLAVLYQTIGDSKKCESTYARLLKDVNSDRQKSGLTSLLTLAFWKNFFNNIQIHRTNLFILIPVGIFILALIGFILFKLFSKRKKKISSMTDDEPSTEKKKSNKKEKTKKLKKTKKIKKDKKVKRIKKSKKKKKGEFQKEEDNSAKDSEPVDDDSNKEEPEEKSEQPASEIHEKEKKDETIDEIEEETKPSEDKSNPAQNEKKRQAEDELKQKIVELLKEGKSTDEIAELLNVGIEEVRLIKKFNSPIKQKGKI